MIPRAFFLLLLFFFIGFSFILLIGEAKTFDPYKVLGIDRSASQRDIRKAFHKLSLKYHPDKNKDKGAQEKFAEINNAYDILSDEEKRKNYDQYGDEKGNPGFGARNGGGSYDGYTDFGGSGSGHFTSGPGGWQTRGSQGNAKSFSFSFGGDPGFGGNPFSFGFEDIFSNLFGSGMSGGNQHGGFGGVGGPKSGYTSHKTLEDIRLQYFNKQIKDQGLTWLLLFYTPSIKGYRMFESIVEDVVSQLNGAVKAGSINCLNEQALCKDLGVSLSKSARLYAYSFRSNGKQSLIEYGGDIDSRSLKNFVLDQLPKFSKRVDLSRFDFSSVTSGGLPHVLLLSAKKETPVIWRVLSGLYNKRFVFYDAEVHDVSLPILKKFGIDSLPAVVGRLVDGEEYLLKSGIAVKDLKSGINELRTLLESFEVKNMKAAKQAKKHSAQEQQGGKDRKVPHLTTSNMDNICSEETAVCIIGAYRSSKAKEKLEAILSEISQKTLLRKQNVAQITYSLLDATKYPSFLTSFDKSGYKSFNKLLVAYKPKRKKFAVSTGELTLEDVENFVSSVLIGDLQFSKIRKQPVLR